MFPIDPSLFFNKPIIYFGSQDIEEKFEKEEEEFDPPQEEIELINPALKGTGIYLHWFDA